jgi:hypothetical protein
MASDDSGTTRKETDWLGREKEVHYDKDGEKTGETRFETDWLGRSVQRHYNVEGDKVGETRKGSDWLGRDRAEHFDSEGNRSGYSKNDADWLGRPVQRHYNQDGENLGSTRRDTDWLGRPLKRHLGSGGKREGLSPRDADLQRGEHSAVGGSSDSSSSSDTRQTTADHRSGAALWTIACVLFATAIFFLLSFGYLVSPKRPSAVPQAPQLRLPETPSYMEATHRVALGNWLLRHPTFRPALTEDAITWNEDLPDIRRNWDNSLPYYVAADFNRDGHTDFAAVLIDKSKDTSQAVKMIKRNPDGTADYTFDARLGWNAALVIFNGPVSGDGSPAFFVEGHAAPVGSVLFYRSSDNYLLVGKWESRGRPITAKGGGYVMD